MSRTYLVRLAFALETLALTLVVVVGVQSFVAQPYRVEHESMADTLEDGQMILVDKLTPRIGGLARGDIVVFRAPPRPGDDGTPYIKRVIGLPGDEVELRDGRVVIDGVPLDESGYVDPEQRTEPLDGASRWLVPDDHVFVLGDHRLDSSDSRYAWLGPIPVADVIGRAVARYWPIEVATVLVAPTYPELAGPPGQAGPVTQASTSRR